MINTVTLMGRLTKDPELTYTQTGKEFTKFNLAVQRDSNKEETDFINCVAWNKTAELICKYFTKGIRILIEGKLQTNSYEKSGEKRYSTDVIISKVHFIDYKDSNISKNTEKNQTFKNNDTPPYNEEEEDFPF